MNPSFDPRKPCTTRSGLPVKIYCTDAPGDYPIHGRIENDRRFEIKEWRKDGAILGCSFSQWDLINIPEAVEEWGNVYPSDSYTSRNYCIYSCCSKEEADKVASPRRIACIPIKFTKGEGL